MREYNKHDVLPGKDNLEDQDVSSSSATEATTNGGLANKDTLGNQDDSQKYYQQEDQEAIPVPKSAHFLRGWLSYYRLRSVSRKTSEGRSHPSRFGLRCLGSTPRMIKL